MPAILKTNRQAVKQSSKFVRVRSNRSSTSGRKIAARRNPSEALGFILRTTTDESGHGKSGFDCLETAARVIEIHYPEMPIAKNMRRLVNEIGRLR